MDWGEPGPGGCGPAPATPNKAARLVFASDSLPAELDDRARFRAWRDVLAAQIGESEMHYSGEVPFAARHEIVPFGQMVVTRYATTMQRYSRSRAQAEADPRDDFLLGFYQGRSAFSVEQRGRELVVRPGRLFAHSNAEAVSSCNPLETGSISGVMIPRALLAERLVRPEDSLVAPLDSANPAVGYLRRYLDFLIAPQESDSVLDEHVEHTILDLVALALGAGRDSAELARGRGLRAARLREILAIIGDRYAEPDFSVRAVAARLGITPRYVNDLLHETGTGFAERVLERRLQHARALLGSHPFTKVIDVALASGFNEVSYFNRCFRRRFGASPTQFRGC